MNSLALRITVSNEIFEIQMFYTVSSMMYELLLARYSYDGRGVHFRRYAELKKDVIINYARFDDPEYVEEWYDDNRTVMFNAAKQVYEAALTDGMNGDKIPEGIECPWSMNDLKSSIAPADILLDMLD